MNRIWTFMILTFYLLFMSIMVDSIGYTASDLTIVNQGFDLSLSGIASVMGTFWRLLSFQIVEVPPLFTVIAIYPASFGFLYIIISIIRGN